MQDIIEKLAKEWETCGINMGDTILLHSRISLTVRRYLKKYNVKLSPEDILNSFLAVLGERGTLILPLFNFDFTKGEPFDVRTTPSQMGLLTEIGRKHKKAVRTKHPVYSFAVIGAKANLFKDVDNYSGYGDDSPFAILKYNHGKIAVLNLPEQQSMTFYHYVEEMNKVPYRFHKIFRGLCTDFKGVTQVREYSIFVRDCDKGVETNVEPMGDYLWQLELYKGFRADQGCGLRVVAAKDVYDITTEIIKSQKYEGMLMFYNRNR